MTDIFGIILSSVMLFSDPFIPDTTELWTYLLIPVLSMLFKTAIIHSYFNGIEFGVFILIQCLIVVGTFILDIVAFGRLWNVWNLVGAVLVIICSIIGTYYL
jgi:hypothetical protein